VVPYGSRDFYPYQNVPDPERWFLTVNKQSSAETVLEEGRKRLYQQ
jgi:hypothetical protein